MSTWVIRIGVAAAANAVTLLVAAAIFDKIEINAWSFIVAVAIFTLAAIAVKPLADRVAGKYASGVTWVAGLATTWLALVITHVFTDGLTIRGAWVWVAGTVVIWLGTLVYDMVDDKLIAAVQERFTGTGTGTGPHPTPT